LRRFDHGFGSHASAVLRVEVGIEGTAVDADANRYAAILGLLGHRLMCSALRMLPGFRRRQCTPASRAASAILYWWWMSATIGTGERGTMCARPSAASISLHVQRTMSAPAAYSA